LNKELLERHYVGIDTEFRRTTKNNMKLALLQINDGEEIFLVDALSINDPKDSCEFLFSDSVIKILHSCKEDLEAIYAWTNKKMQKIFDTQLANSFLDDDYSISYRSLVEKKLGIVLEKKETRSNWLRRPLSNDQLKYAALDVEYLLYLYEEQIAELSLSNKLEWHNQDIDHLMFGIFDGSLNNLSNERIIPRLEEEAILNKFNSIVEKISRSEGINSTLFFSKKSQKEFLRLVLSKGFDKASQGITIWRRDLIEHHLIDLLK
tara:strand:+ start:45618 stop:46406 length:789 start_codon:yes stop_codon:yes gene_type:complete